MIRRYLSKGALSLLGSAAILLILAPVGMQAQFGAPPPQPVRPAKQIAPEDLTGYWVSIVTEDWRWRMVTPAKGDYASVPLSRAGRATADMWDPAKDIAAGNQCKAYGAAAIMRVPGRLHITWVDDNTLKIETDAGTQTRIFHFNAQPASGQAASWQGYSMANWDGLRPAPRGGGPAPKGGSLKVVTTDMKPGYLRKNGVPYSGNTELTEYYDRTNEPNGDSWLIVTTIVHDPVNLNQDFVTSTHFKMEPDGSKWSPTTCQAK
ncbi:MAG: hypothetical protein JOZ32_05670 [Bryobacterales bacterium]|nr:hypothetical protein [Bryobacterales bacterium]